MVFTFISVNIKTATVFWVFLFVLFYFLCWVAVWACVTFLSVTYVVFRLQRNCIFCTTRCVIGILAACSAVQNQRLTLVLTVASLGSTWDLPWIGNNRRPFIFFPSCFRFLLPCTMRMQAMMENTEKLFLSFCCCCLFSALQRCWMKLSSCIVIYMLFSLFVHNVILKYYPVQLRMYHPYVCVLHQIVLVVDFICVRW